MFRRNIGLVIPFSFLICHIGDIHEYVHLRFSIVNSEDQV